MSICLNIVELSSLEVMFSAVWEFNQYGVTKGKLCSSCGQQRQQIIYCGDEVANWETRNCGNIQVSRNSRKLVFGEGSFYFE